MKKILTLLMLVLVIGCDNKQQEHPPVLIEKVDTIYLSSTPPVDTYQKTLDSTIQELLIQHYKAGWMDGSGAIIDLNNAGNLTDKAVKKIQFKQWREIEAEIRKK